MRERSGQVMWERLFRLSRDGLSRGGALSFQDQIRQMFVSAILEHWLPPGSQVPSSRSLAERLGVSRNTVVLAYEQLVDDGFLVSRERSGYRVGLEMHVGYGGNAKPGGEVATTAQPPSPDTGRPDWTRRLKYSLSTQRNIVKPRNWQSLPYPFVYGQFDATLFPLAEWRECCRLALGVQQVRDWAPDGIDEDDPLLVEQIRRLVLPARGIWPAPEEIMVTIGAQQALFLIADLLFSADSVVGLEDPGYPDARNIFSLRSGRLRGLPVDDGGLILDSALRACDYVYLTPSHQCPTGVTMPMERRVELLRLADERGMVLIEDDYDSEASFAAPPTPALKSLDHGERVIYVGSLSKILAPGLRLGYIVAQPQLIREARALRRLMLRHPPANNQRAAALFFSLGHYETLQRRWQHALRERAAVLEESLSRHLPDFRCTHGAGGSSYWIEGPRGLDAGAVAAAAGREGILVESGAPFFFAEEPPLNYLRLGLSSIRPERIDTGIRMLARLADAAPAASAPDISSLGAS